MTILNPKYQKSALEWVKPKIGADEDPEDYVQVKATKPHDGHIEKLLNISKKEWNKLHSRPWPAKLFDEENRPRPFTDQEGSLVPYSEIALLLYFRNFDFAYAEGKVHIPIEDNDECLNDYLPPGHNFEHDEDADDEITLESILGRHQEWCSARASFDGEYVYWPTPMMLRFTTPGDKMPACFRGYDLAIFLYAMNGFDFLPYTGVIYTWKRQNFIEFLIHAFDVLPSYAVRFYAFFARHLPKFDPEELFLEEMLEFLFMVGEPKYHKPGEDEEDTPQMANYNAARRTKKSELPGYDEDTCTMSNNAFFDWQNYFNKLEHASRIIELGDIEGVIEEAKDGALNVPEVEDHRPNIYHDPQSFSAEVPDSDDVTTIRYALDTTRMSVDFEPSYPGDAENLEELKAVYAGWKKAKVGGKTLPPSDKAAEVPNLATTLQKASSEHQQEVSTQPQQITAPDASITLAEDRTQYPFDTVDPRLLTNEPNTLMSNSGLANPYYQSQPLQPDNNWSFDSLAAQTLTHDSGFPGIEASSDFAQPPTLPSIGQSMAPPALQQSGPTPLEQPTPIDQPISSPNEQITPTQSTPAKHGRSTDDLYDTTPTKKPRTNETAPAFTKPAPLNKSNLAHLNTANGHATSPGSPVKQEDLSTQAQEREVGTPAEDYTLWQLGDTEDNEMVSTNNRVFDLARGNHKRYFALDGPVDINNLPPKNVHLEDCQVLGLLQLQEIGGISEAKLRQFWPLTFNSKGFIHEQRAPFGRPGVVSGTDGRWYVAAAHRRYLLMGGGARRKDHPGNFRVRPTGGFPWISKTVLSTAKKWDELDKEDRKTLITSTELLADFKIVDWPTVVDLSRIPKAMANVIIEHSETNAGCAAVATVMDDLADQDLDNIEPFSTTRASPKYTPTVKTRNYELGEHPILFSTILFQGRLNAIDAAQKAKEAEAERLAQEAEQKRQAEETKRLQEEAKAAVAQATNTKVAEAFQTQLDQTVSLGASNIATAWSLYSSVYWTLNELGRAAVVIERQNIDHIASIIKSANDSGVGLTLSKVPTYPNSRLNLNDEGRAGLDREYGKTPLPENLAHLSPFFTRLRDYNRGEPTDEPLAEKLVFSAVEPVVEAPPVAPMRDLLAERKLKRKTSKESPVQQDQQI